MNTQDPLIQALSRRLIKDRKEWLRDYQDFLRFASVSSEKESKPQMHACVEWLVQYLSSIHFEVELWETSGYPVIFASKTSVDLKKPTLLLYHHYDVQPADPLSEWLSPPFEPTEREGKIYARGAQDNKGQCFYVLLALKILQEELGNLPINIKLCIEGEEEIGSHGLASILMQKSAALKADYLAIVDLGLEDPHIPAITLGTRGIVTMDVELSTAKLDLHSGSHGGIVLNPIDILVKLLANLKEESGKVAIPNFYSDIEEMSEQEKSLFSFNFDAVKYYELTGAHPYGGEKSYLVLERAWMRPTLEINGISAGYTGDGFKTVIPGKALAKLSCRLVPGQDPKKIGSLIEKFLQDHLPSGANLRVNVHLGDGKAVRISPTANVVKIFSKAYEILFGIPCQYILEGGSIPIAPELQLASGAQTVLLGLGLKTDQIHAPNEHFDLERIEKGALMIAKAIELFAE